MNKAYARREAVITQNDIHEVLNTISPNVNVKKVAEVGKWITDAKILKLTKIYLFEHAQKI